MVPDAVQIPNRSLFRQPEVCEIAQVQPYVLRTWEAEFPELGVAKSAGASRVYRREDVERVLRIKHLLFVEGLTLAGARRRMQDEGTVATPPPQDSLDDLLTSDVRERILSVRQTLRELAALLAQRPSADAEFALQAPVVKATARKLAPSKAPAKSSVKAPVKKAAKKK